MSSLSRFVFFHGIDWGKKKEKKSAEQLLSINSSEKAKQNYLVHAMAIYCVQSSLRFIVYVFFFNNYLLLLLLLEIFFFSSLKKIDKKQLERERSTT